LTLLPGYYHIYFRSHQLSEKVAFSAGIRLPESRINLSQTPMYVTMADPA